MSNPSNSNASDPTRSHKGAAAPKDKPTLRSEEGGPVVNIRGPVTPIVIQPNLDPTNINQPSSPNPREVVSGKDPVPPESEEDRIKREAAQNDTMSGTGTGLNPNADMPKPVPFYQVDNPNDPMKAKDRGVAAPKGMTALEKRKWATRLRNVADDKKQVAAIVDPICCSTEEDPTFVGIVKRIQGAKDPNAIRLICDEIQGGPPAAAYGK